MNGVHSKDAENIYHDQELRIALVMNGGVSLAVWIGGVTQEINRLVRGEAVYGPLCEALSLRPRVDIISGTSAGGINGALLALATSQGKSLDPLRDIWLEKGDILTLLRKPTQDDPPSFLDGGYFYKAMVEGFRSIRDQHGGGLEPPARVPIELTLTTTVLVGEKRDFPDDMGAMIRDVTHRGLIKFNRGPDIAGDPFAGQDIVSKLAAAARATASFPAAFEPFYLPSVNEKVEAKGEAIPCLIGHTDFNRQWKEGRYVVDGGVLDNNPLESAIDAVFRQRAEGEVRRVLAFVVPDPGHIPDPPSQKPDRVPTLVSTALASLVNIPRVESVSDQMRAIARHNQNVSRQRDTRLLVARSLDWAGGADQVAASVFPGYRLRRAQSAADYIAAALVEGAAQYQDAAGHGIAFGLRSRERIANAILQMKDLPWLPDNLAYSMEEGEWKWGLFTLQGAMAVVLDLLRRGVRLVPARRSEITNSLWESLMQSRRKAYDLIHELNELRNRDRGYWMTRGKALALVLAGLEQGTGDSGLPQLLLAEIQGWVRQWDQDFSDQEKLRPPRDYAAMAGKIGGLFMDSTPLLKDVLALGMPARGAQKFAELSTLADFLLMRPTDNDPWHRLLTLEVVHYAFGADTTRDQFLELIQFSANVPTSFGGPDRLEQKLAGVQVAHFGAFYKRSWRINDWMFGRLDGADRLIRVLLNPSRLARLYGWDSDDANTARTGTDTVLDLLHGVLMDGLAREDDRIFLQAHWNERLSDMRKELAFLDTADGLPEQLPECAALVLERLHLDILRSELPALADAVGDDELDGADASGKGPKFLKRFRSALFPDDGKMSKRSPRVSGAPDLPAEQLVQLFKGAKVGEEKILEEVGSDRFTITASRSAAVAVTALSGKRSGLGWLRTVFITVRTPLVVLDILARALMKKGRVFVSLYAMAMAASATVLLAGSLAEAKWSSSVTTAAAVILTAGFAVLLRRHPRLLICLALLVILIWKVLPFLSNCFG